MAAATPLPVSVSEYLHTSYRPDCDYVDGVVEERNLGEFNHSALQEAILEWFRSHRGELALRAYPELRGFDFSPGSWAETSIFVDAATGIRLDLAALFASIDDALGDSGNK
jgi:hypothetical protein